MTSWRILKQKSFSSRKSSADAAEEETAAEETDVTTETDAAAEEAAVIGADVTAGMGVTTETDVTAEEAAAIRTDAMTEKDIAEERDVTVEKDMAAENMTAGSRAGTAVTRRSASKQRSESQYQLAAMLFKPSARVAVVRIHGFHSIPEGGGVIHVCQMTQLMDDDVIQNLWRR